MTTVIINKRLCKKITFENCDIEIIQGAIYSSEIEAKFTSVDGWELQKPKYIQKPEVVNTDKEIRVLEKKRDFYLKEIKTKRDNAIKAKQGIESINTNLIVVLNQINKLKANNES